MCRIGVLERLRELQTTGLALCRQRQWHRVPDGFGRTGTGPELLEDTCPACGAQFPVVRRLLESGGYNLPDASANQRLRYRQPCIALGIVQAGRTTLSTNPTRHHGLTERWQGLMWHELEVAFVAVEDEGVGSFSPAAEWWGDKAPVPEINEMASVVENAVCVARYTDRVVPVVRSDGAGDSRATEDRLEPLVSKALLEFEFGFVGKQQPFSVFWSGRRLDLLYRHHDGRTLGVEVKVDEDWDHPLAHPTSYLMEHNAMLLVRVPHDPRQRKCQLDAEGEHFAAEAQRLMAATGRVEYICVG